MLNLIINIDNSKFTNNNNSSSNGSVIIGFDGIKFLSTVTIKYVNIVGFFLLYQLHVSLIMLFKFTACIYCNLMVMVIVNRTLPKQGCD